jgi:hypothetical protein
VSDMRSYHDLTHSTVRYRVTLVTSDVIRVPVCSDLYYVVVAELGDGEGGRSVVSSLSGWHVKDTTILY